ALIALACSGGSATPSPTQTPAPSASSSPASPAPSPAATSTATTASTPTAARSACPVAAARACTLATAPQQALQVGDLDPIATMFNPIQSACRGPGYPADANAGLCQGHAAGDSVTGYSIVQGGAGTLVARGQLLQFLGRFAISGPVNQHDDYGDW